LRLQTKEHKRKREETENKKKREERIENLNEK